MSYAAAEARQELLDALAEAIGEIDVALSALGDAYDELDERSADRLEAELFRPLQAAYGRSKRVHEEFAQRHGLRSLELEASPRLPVASARDLVEHAVDAAAQADEAIVELQDSGMPVEVGDQPLRAGLAEVRRLLADVTAHARELLRVLGR